MRLYFGTSGFSYKPWKGPFYPEDLPDDQMLSFYAGKLSAVEINNTFYRMPKADLLERWADSVPETFRFALKASQRITHRARLENAGESVEYLWNAMQALGAHLGPVLFQLPPNFRQDLERLRAFLAELPDDLRAAFEFRHESWTDAGTLQVLRDGGAALCVADLEDAPEPELSSTTHWGYLRLRGVEYPDESLARWAQRIRATGWKEAFVFFKHEDASAGPEMALRFADIFANGLQAGPVPEENEA